VFSLEKKRFYFIPVYTNADDVVGLIFCVRIVLYL